MLNYCILIILFSAWVLVLTAYDLSATLAKAFADALPQTPPDPPPSAGPDYSGPVLAYAPRPPKRPLFLYRYRSAAFVGTVVQSMALLSLPLGAPILLWASLDMFQQHAFCAMAVGIITLTLSACIANRGLRQNQGVPAATRWPRRKLLKVLLWGIPILGLVALALDAGTRYRLHRIRDAMDARSQDLRLAVPSGTPNAADVYSRIYPLLVEVPDWISRYSPHDSPPTAPPALPTELEQAIRHLHDASQLPVADWGIDLKPLDPATPLPHLSKLRWAALALRIHAAREAMAGRPDSALRDIRAIHGIARHMGQAQSPWERSAFDSICRIAYASTEDALPFTDDEQLLRQLLEPQDDRHRKMRVRMLQGEQAFCLRLMADTYNGRTQALMAPPPPLAPPLPLGLRSTTPMQWSRVLLADTDLAAARRQYDGIEQIASGDPTQAVRAIRQLDSPSALRGRWRDGLLTGLMTPTVPWGVSRNIATETMGQLSNVGIAARRFCLRTGRLPTNLDELVTAGLLDHIPTDPFSGQPILMKAQKDQIIIYSVGPDGRDDGGDYITYNKDLTFRLGTKPLWEIDAAAAQADQATATQEPPPSLTSTPTSRPK